MSELLGCPFCGAQLAQGQFTAFHPTNDCWLGHIGDHGGGYELDLMDYDEWNRRVFPVGGTTRKEPEPSFPSSLPATGGEKAGAPLSRVAEGERERLIAWLKRCGAGELAEKAAALLTADAEQAREMRERIKELEKQLAANRRGGRTIDGGMVDG